MLSITVQQCYFPTLPFLSIFAVSSLSLFNIFKMPYCQLHRGKSLSHAHGWTCSGEQKFSLDRVCHSGMLYSLAEESEKGQRIKLVLIVTVDLM